MLMYRMTDFKMNLKLNTLTNEADLYIYDEIKSDGFNYWTGEEEQSDTDEKRISDKLNTVPEDYTINVYISSGGGSVKTGLAIYALLKRKKCKLKRAYIDGMACSIASVIPMACDEVIMYPTSLLMIHAASAGVWGNAVDHRRVAAELDIITNSVISAYSDKAGDKLKYDELLKMLEQDTWLNAEQCLAYGLCDRIEKTQRAASFRGTALENRAGLFAAAAAYASQFDMKPAAKAEKQPVTEEAEPAVVTDSDNKAIDTAAIAAAFVNSLT